MTQTLVLVFHPDLSRSHANAALASAARTVPGVTVIDMTATRADGGVSFSDADAQAAMLMAADRIVLQFPLHWYSTPPLLKAWQDAVLTRMVYLAPEEEGRHLRRKPLMLAVTAGNKASAYRPGGANLMPLTDLLAPLWATANRCGLVMDAPFFLYEADRLTPAERDAAAGDYATALERWISATTPAEV
ncbi:NAD(P)H-dependent oxidoreductase [Paracoccus sp. PAMC 22219]|uniref:NAD(P)H-dependent oxidoreductase n=1 Tax=Paracoccus sp. PAMC 22219 TaxID=1569209 RepID=UPI0005A64C57|nr:NAD(P)H-dependent oxidoreductase [Paracoccus sp. PAMC 22219]